MLNILKCSGNKVQIQFLSKIICRKYMKVSEKMEMLLKQKDRIPHDFTLIYRHKEYKLSTFLYHTLNLTTCFTVAVSIHYIYNRTNETIWLGKIPLFKHVYEPLLLVFCSIGMIILTALLRQRYAIRIYKNEKTKMCRAIYIGKMPFTCEFYDFPNRSLKYVKKNSLFPFLAVTFNANGRKIMLFDEKFRSPYDFNDLLDKNELLDNNEY